MLEEYLMKVRHAELQDEAGKIHLAAKIKPEPFMGFKAAVVFIGVLLQGWGRWLEERYVIENSAAQVHPVDCGLEV
jgi:hypothetical protein